MDKAQRLLSIQKFDIILDNNNKPINAKDFVEKLEGSKKLKDLYLTNIEIWIVYFKKQLDKQTINPILIENKLAEVLHVANYFTKEKWPDIYRTISRIEALIS